MQIYLDTLFRFHLIKWETNKGEMMMEGKKSKQKIQKNKMASHSITSIIFQTNEGKERHKK